MDLFTEIGLTALALAVLDALYLRWWAHRPKRPELQLLVVEPVRTQQIAGRSNRRVVRGL